MLTTKRINLGISILSRILRVFIILYSAAILANSVWWILSPANTDIFVQQPSLDIRDKQTSYIKNNAPFGVVVVKVKVQEKPRIVDQLKLTGVYLNTDKDSFAFLEYQGKPVIARIGGKIANTDATIKSITASNIVVNADDQDVTMKITAGGATQAASGQQGGAKNPSTLFGNRGGSFGGANTENTSASSQQNIEDFRQRRKKMLEEYNSRGSADKTRERSSVSDDE
jgi:type II secretory pathway component PulC